MKKKPKLLSPVKTFKTLRESPHLSRTRMLVVVVAFAVIGSVFLIISHAATPFASVQPEGSTINSPAITGTDANASGGSFVQFKAATNNSAVGPDGPVGPVATTAPAGAIQVSPGANFSSYAANAVIYLKAGTYSNVSIQPKDGQQYIGALGAVLDGGGGTGYAFSGGASNVTIKNLKIQHYSTGSSQDAAVAPDGSDWKVLNNEITENNGLGLSTATRMTASYNYIHHNHEMGFGGGGDLVVVSNNHVSYNNYLGEYCPGWEAGGSKMWGSTNATISHNESDHNVGPGLWDDGLNNNILYEYNSSHDNDWAGSNCTENPNGTGKTYRKGTATPGIFHEIGGSATIRYNDVRNNNLSWDDPGWPWGPGILISSSGSTDPTEIFGNNVIGNVDGIMLLNQNRCGVEGEICCPPGITTIENVYVHNNIIRTNGGTGAASDISLICGGGNSDFFSRNNRFDYNTYNAGYNNFDWRGPTDKAGWQAAGMDTHGTWN